MATHNIHECLLFINLYSQLVDAANFIEIIVPTEYDNKSSQIPMAKRLFSSKTKRIFMNIKWGLFLYTPVHGIMEIPFVQNISNNYTIN